MHSSNKSKEGITITPFEAEGKLGLHEELVVSSVCPGCKHKVRFVKPVPVLHDLCDTKAPFTYYGVRLCPDDECNALVLFCSIPDMDGLWIYPRSKTSLRLDHVPLDIKNDAKEALSVFEAGAWKSTIVMCRRAVQASCIQKGAKPGKLASQIDELQANGLLTVQLKDWAHQIRKFGNFGAHPDEDLGDATEDDAAQMMEFLDTFLRYVYEMPAKIEAARKRSEKQKTQPVSGKN